jgi:hypothetical protein
MPICGNCKQTHETAREVRACYGLIAQRPPAQTHAERGVHRAVVVKRPEDERAGNSAAKARSKVRRRSGAAADPSPSTRTPPDPSSNTGFFGWGPQRPADAELHKKIGPIQNYEDS